MMLYDLRIKVEKLYDDGDYRYMASSPDLPNLIVAGDTVDEVLALAPQIASALIASMKAAGDPLPKKLRVVSTLPTISHVMVSA
jgi:predicted RNase H-like HicB family nuclease